MQVVVIVVAIVGGIGVIQAAVWIPLGLRWRRCTEAYWQDFHAQLAASGERLVRGPEKGIYRGSTGSGSKVEGNGRMVLTDRRLVFRKLTGGVVEVPVADIAAVHHERSFRGSRAAGQTVLVLDLADRSQVGFVVPDLAGWTTALRPATAT